LKPSDDSNCIWDMWMKTARGDEASAPLRILFPII